MTLERAISIATAVHEGQLDKGKHPYILHPLRVMMECVSYGLDTMVVAVLHDTIEDALDKHKVITLGDMDTLNQSQIEALNALTRAAGEDYAAYIDRVRTSPLAVVVKRADLRDNMDLNRLRRAATKYDLLRNERYAEALKQLGRA